MRGMSNGPTSVLRRLALYLDVTDDIKKVNAGSKF